MPRPMSSAESVRASENNRSLAVQQGQSLLNSEIGAFKVGIHQQIKERFIRLSKRPGVGDACIDKQDVQFAKGFLRACHQLVKVTQLCDVCGNPQNMRTQLVGDRFELL